MLGINDALSRGTEENNLLEKGSTYDMCICFYTEYIETNNSSTFITGRSSAIAKLNQSDVHDETNR